VTTPKWATPARKLSTWWTPSKRERRVAQPAKWATSERKRQLVELFHRYNNQCLLGHRVCPDPTHYIHHTIVGIETVAAPGKPFRARDSDGGHSGPLVPTLVLKTVPVAGMQMCRLYEREEEAAIRQWRSEDISQRAADWREERKRLHREPHRFKQGGFDSITRENYLVERGAFHPDTLTIDPLTFRRVAKVRIPSTDVCLFVDVHDVTGRVSKNARRRASRYQVPLPKDVAVQVDGAIYSAVEDWWAHRR
jgi:hypothetical protein